jgi:hypothetical protein
VVQTVEHWLLLALAVSGVAVTSRTVGRAVDQAAQAAVVAPIARIVEQAGSEAGNGVAKTNKAAGITPTASPVSPPAP